MANKKLQKRALAVERYKLDAYHIQMILDLKISFDSLAKRHARAWDNNRWSLAEYLEYRYLQEFGKARPEKPAFVPPLSKVEKMKRVNGTSHPTPAHPVYGQKARVLREAREQAGLTVLELAKVTNLRPEAIETLEDPDSRKAVSFETLGEIAAVLGLELKVSIRLERSEAANEHDPKGLTEHSMPLMAANGSSNLGPPAHWRAAQSLTSSIVVQLDHPKPNVSPER